MHYITTGIIKMFSLFILQVLLQSTLCFSFLDTDDFHGITTLRRDIKILIGVVDDTVHKLTLAKGTHISDIPSQISQKRQDLGLSPDVPLEQQDSFFQDCSWQTTKDVTLTAPMPGKIVQVFVHKGQLVERGDYLYELESMKMFSIIATQYSGIIEDIFVKLGQIIDCASVILNISPHVQIWENIDQAKILEIRDMLTSFFPWETAVPDRGKKNKSTSASATIHFIREESILEEHPPASLHVLQADAAMSLLITGERIEPDLNPTPPNPMLLIENTNLNQSLETTLEDALLRPSVPLAKSSAPQFIQIPLEDSVSLEQKPIPLPLIQQATLALSSSYEQESEPQNSPLSVTLTMSKALVLQNSELPSRLEFTHNEKEAKVFSKTKALSKEKIMNKSEDKLEFSIVSWAKWILGLLALGKLISIKTTNKLRIKYLRSRIFHSHNFNNYRMIDKKIASNLNQTPWSQKERLKVHALLGY